MPRITTVGPDARGRLVRKSGGRDELAPYREAIASLDGDAHIEIAPEEGESMRAVKLRVTRAARQVNKDVRYGDTTDGSVLVWLASPTRRRGRRRAAASKDTLTSDPESA